MPLEQSVEQQPCLTAMLSSVAQLARFSTASSWHFWLTPFSCMVVARSITLSTAKHTPYNQREAIKKARKQCKGAIDCPAAGWWNHVAAVLETAVLLLEAGRQHACLPSNSDLVNRTFLTGQSAHKDSTSSVHQQSRCGRSCSDGSAVFLARWQAYPL